MQATTQYFVKRFFL